MPARLTLYDTVAQRAADLVVREYSTSFGLATRILAAHCRTDIRNVYALVRLADEVVDGAAAEAGGDAVEAGRLLDALEAETERALERGYSTNLLVHAFARTARRAGIREDLTRPFFASMRMDLERTVHDAESLATYVYGSAEVVGLMCLRVFLLDVPPAEREARYERLTPGARALGAAFQKINFLRDLADDSDRLGRSYFVDVDPQNLTEEQKRVILADIENDLRLAATAMAGLPGAARRAVAVAYGLFAELTRRLSVTPAAEIARTRVRVPGPVKVRVAARALRGGGSRPTPGRLAPAGAR
ncbi:phytoene/squalene synthase family protein [Actinotalea subterranea]|uniref:phytoene/squalene synthase family protein n=1 Tax=Actinotalea subterranea TaxID=2607497 RepID=UPI0011EEC1B8|nr:squalene/phytoene synthase family protein [Actinotalea subterranea]